RPPVRLLTLRVAGSSLHPIGYPRPAPPRSESFRRLFAKRGSGLATHQQCYDLVSSVRYDEIDTWKKQGRSAVLLWLLTMNLGTSLGAGLYESRVVVSDWPKMPPSEWPNTGVEFWAYVTTVPLTTLTILNAVAAWRDRSPRRRSW